MKLEFYNCPQPADIKSVNLPEKPEFVKYKPDFGLMKKLADEYKQIKNIIIAAHGGSITSFYGFYNALKYQAKKEAYFLSTTDPDYIYELKQKLKPEKNLFILIKKKNENTKNKEKKK